ncbi:putative chitosanase [Planoprotostelium fungivorum]|uniref:Putative chitosanase n=1 Tax=Planoprotostelium fungivorum TaxID=1890364 RepID=A0A2P6P0D1_9EUKA|nr:putative chitosanase [Planoprotostelium fungivorum]
MTKSLFFILVVLVTAALCEGTQGDHGPIDDGYDRPGSDFKKVKAQSVQLCQNQCFKYAKCVAFAFATCGDNQGSCWLKSSVGTSTPVDCRASGIVNHNSSSSTGSGSSGSGTSGSGTSGSGTSGSGSSGSGTSGGSSTGGSSTGSSSGNGGDGHTFTDCQKEIAYRATSVYENSQVELKFDYCENIHDGGGYTAGFPGFNTASGDLYDVVKNFVQVYPQSPLSKLLPRLKQVVNSDNVDGLDSLCGLWAQASHQNQTFNTIQWDYVTENYWNPSQRYAEQYKLWLPLTRAQLYDACIEQFSLGGMVKNTNNQVGAPSDDQASQERWLKTFLQVRIDALNKKGYGDTAYRVVSYQYALSHGGGLMKGNEVSFLDNDGSPISIKYCAIIPFRSFESSSSSWIFYTRLYPVDKRSYLQLASLLHSFLPYSLPALGHIAQQSHHALLIWTTLECLPIDSSIWPHRFGVYILALPDLTRRCRITDQQSRFFTSIDGEQIPPSPEDVSFVQQFVRAGLSSALGALRGDNNDVSLPRGLVVGSVHHKWVPHLQPTWTNPCFKFIRPPSPLPPLQVPEGFIVSPLVDDDLDAIVAASHIVRSKEYLSSRIEAGWSGAIRSTDGKLAAWAFIHVDGSIGTLNVVEEFRRSRLATCIMRVMMQKLEERPETADWMWVDTECDNEKGLSFFGQLEGWKSGWGSTWMGFSPESL